MLNKILDSCKYVVDNSKDVKINYQSIDKLIEDMKNINKTHWLEIEPFNILQFDVKDIINLLLVYHSIGFCYFGDQKWTIESEYGKLDGSFAMLYILVKEMKNNKNFFSADNLQNMSRNKFKELLKGNIEIPLLEQRYLNILSIGKSINDKMNGDFFEYIKNITTDIELFNIIINEFDIFDDVTKYEGRDIYLYKLAQILVSDILHVREIKEKTHVEYNHLVGCADYKIPQILRSMEILEYSNKLSSIVDSKVEIEKDSSYEIQIRASTIIVINIINKKLNEKICPININDFIWLKGQEKTNMLKPYHLTRTKFY